ncbi:Rha family transcriptional regulator [Escherichia phage vB_EcoS-BECP10]|uniref:Rha family transcriptional regulator n=1 Tax=Escherichia phage vB_EcoS-BECP10 TaxID=2797407 RepID=A0A7T7GU16_9CAUD|nr:Rha family transcriptional regulator [Escherichia phage vB_EcoS-BECP10]
MVLLLMQKNAPQNTGVKIIQPQKREMIDMNLINIDENVTMSSLEIAELTGKRHDNVVRDIREMLNDNEICSGFSQSHSSNLRSEIQNESRGSNVDRQIKHPFESEYKNSRGQTQPCFNLPYRETMILMVGYNRKVAAKIVDRWLHLERENKLLKEHMKKMVSLDEVKVYKVEAASAKAAQHRAEDNYYAIEKFMFKNMDKCENPAELDEQYFDVKFESNRYHDSQELVYKYQAQLEVACEKLKAKDDLIANLVHKGEPLKLGKK